MVRFRVWLVGVLATALLIAITATFVAVAQDCDDCAVAIGDPGQVYDSDWDGINDTSESYKGTDPYDDDTDGDGIRDGDEYNDVYARSDPTSGIPTAMG